jgi:hypothetical protein
MAGGGRILIAERNGVTSDLKFLHCGAARQRAAETCGLHSKSGGSCTVALLHGLAFADDDGHPRINAVNCG